MRIWLLADLQLPHKGNNMSNKKAYENIEKLIHDNMSMGDIVILDNIYVEQMRGESIDNLATKYGKTTKEIKELLEKCGVKFND